MTGSETVRQVQVYTDGGCDPNPGPGGWGAIIRWTDREWVLSGNDPDTTNNRMELQAAAAALALLEGVLGRCQVRIHTDSHYLRRGITQWLPDWVSRGWRTSAKQAVKNQDLWRALYRLTQAHDVAWSWVRGHTGHPLNERADRLATEALRSLGRGPGAPDTRHPGVTDKPAVEIFVKASSRGAQGPGGWGAVLRTSWGDQGVRIRTLSGREPATTANAMLLRGATEALRVLTRPCRVTIHSDAKYLIQGASQWLKGWQARGWKTRDGNPVANQAEWQSLLEASSPHDVTWSLAHGEAVLEDLDRAGELASQASGIERDRARGNTD